MKKIIPLLLGAVLLPASICTADSDIDKLKGCWRSIGGGLEKFTDDAVINLNNGDKFRVKYDGNETHISYTIWLEQYPEFKETMHINRKSITDKSFVQSHDMLEYKEGEVSNTRIECPK